MYLTQNLVLSLDFLQFYCTTCISDGFAAHACALKDFLALFFSPIKMNRVTD